MNARYFGAAGVAIGLLLASSTKVRADELFVRRAPLPEPLFTETVTDIDGHEAGEIEFEMNISEWGASRGGARVLAGSVEGEMLLTSRLGVRAEVFAATSRGIDDGVASHPFGGNLGASFKLLQDWKHEVYLQLEATGRYPWDASTVVEPGEPTLPFAFDLRGGLRRGDFTFRSSLGTTAGGAPAHVPLRGSFGVFTTFSTDRYGFWGVEFDLDGARRTPAVVALNLVPSLIPAGLPIKIGLAIPVAIGTSDSAPSLGVFARIWIESAREIEYGERREARSRP